MKRTMVLADEMAGRGLAPVFAEAQFNTSACRLARALKAFALPAEIRKSDGRATALNHGPAQKEVLLWTNTEGHAIAALVVKVARILGKLHMVTEDRFALGRVAERLHAYPDVLTELRVAYNLDAPEHVLEMIVWPIKDAILPVPPTKETTP
jgi:hypothetical protein